MKTQFAATALIVACGVAAPGMSPAAPGIDTPGRKDPYQVLLVDASGRSSVYAHYPK